MTIIKFETVPVRESHEKIVDLEKFGFIVEPVYFNQGFSTEKRMFLREEVANKLKLIEKDIFPFRFKIWDGYRSRTVQNNIYESFLNKLAKDHPDWDDEKLTNEVGIFVTSANDANRVPPHATGGSVDLTLVDEKGEDLDMGTKFDHFGPEASSLYLEDNDNNLKARDNRRILRNAMANADFRVDEDEWWHFDYGNQIWALILQKPYAIYGEVKE